MFCLGHESPYTEINKQRLSNYLYMTNKNSAMFTAPGRDFPLEKRI